MTVIYPFLVTLTTLFLRFQSGICASRYSGRDRILLFNNDIFFGASKMPNRYNFRYLTEGRQYREEAGYTVRRGAESIMKVRGKFYYTGDDGRVYETVYEADENGYRPVSRIVGGVKYPYPERFPAPLPDIPLRSDDNDLTDLTPFGTEYGTRTPNRGQTRQRTRPRPTLTTSTTPFPDDEDEDKRQNQFDEGEDYDYPLSNGGEKRDTKKQNNNSQSTKEQSNFETTEAESYAFPPDKNSNKPLKSLDSSNDSGLPATDFQPPVEDHEKTSSGYDYKPPKPKNGHRRKNQGVTIERNDDFLDSLFGT